MEENFSIYDLKLTDILPESLADSLDKSYLVEIGLIDLDKKFRYVTVEELDLLALPLMGATEGRVIGGVVLSVWCHETLYKLALKKFDK